MDEFTCPLCGGTTFILTASSIEYNTKSKAHVILPVWKAECSRPACGCKMVVPRGAYTKQEMEYALNSQRPENTGGHGEDLRKEKS